MHRGAFAQELGIGCHRELAVGLVLVMRRKDSRTIDSTQLPLPMGTVDLFTTTTKSPSKCCPIPSAAARR